MNEKKELELAFKLFDRLLNYGDFDQVDWLLRVIDPDNLEALGIVGILSMTRAATAFLPCRRLFLARAEPRLRDLVGVERAEVLLKKRR